MLVSKQAELVAGSDNSWSVELNVRLRPGGRVERHDSLVHGMRYGSEEEALSEASVSSFLDRLKELFVPDASGTTAEAQRNRHRRASMPLPRTQALSASSGAVSTVLESGAATSATGPSYRRASIGASVATQPASSLPWYAQGVSIAAAASEQASPARMRGAAQQTSYAGPNMALRPRTPWS